MLEMCQQSPGSVGQSIQIKPDYPPKKNSLFNSMSLWCTDIGSSVSKTGQLCSVYKLFGVWTSSQEPVGLFLLNLSPSRKLVVKKYFSNKNHWVDQIYSKE